MRTTVEIIAINLLVSTTFASAGLPLLDFSRVLQALNDTCAVLVIGSPVDIDGDYVRLLTALREGAFGDGGVLFGMVDYWDLVSQPRTRIATDPPLTEGLVGAILALERKLPDRACLLSSALTHKEVKGGLYNGVADPSLVLSFVNEFCGTYKTLNGDLDERGERRQNVLRNLYVVEPRVDMKRILDSCGEEANLKAFFYSGKCEGRLKTELPKCETVDGATMTKKRFFSDYLSRSKPFIMKNYLSTVWPMFRDWTSDYFRRRFGRQRVHVKLTPSGEFEGVESASLWSECGDEERGAFCDAPLASVPEEVKRHLTFSKHLVVVRPAAADMPMGEFLDLLEGRRQWMGYNGSLSAYLEYAPVSENFVGFNEQLVEFPFVKDLLKLDLLNMWLSNGDTLGKLHFDQYDNFLCQVSGKKRVILFEPHNNTQLYEGHIVEADLAFVDGRFVRRGLMQSTALTMSPVDIEYPDFQVFPAFANAHPLNCTIEPGDVLFIPSFWWHEVQSYPDQHSRRNLAFNFWYDPFLRKEFPCSDCGIDVNPAYRHC